MTVRELLRAILVDLDYKPLDTEIRMEAPCCEYGHTITGARLQDDLIMLTYDWTSTEDKS